MSQKQKWFYSEQEEKVWTSILKQNQIENDYKTNSVKYRGIKIDSKLDWKAHINNIALKPMQIYQSQCNAL